MKESVKIVHTADLHLGAAAVNTGDASERSAEMRITAENIFKLCREESADLLLIAGDLFESNSVDDGTVESVFSAIANIAETQVVFAAGNHDPLTSDSPFLKYRDKLPENLTVLKTEDSCVEFEELGVRIYGKSFSSVYMEKSERFGIEPINDGLINIMVLHADKAGDSKYNPINDNFIKSSKMDYIALGHIHKYSGIMRLENTFFAYPGCPEPHGFDECGEKGVILATVFKNKVDARFVPISRRRYETVNCDITGVSNSVEITDRIFLEVEKFENYADNYYKIFLVGNVDPSVKISQKEIEIRLNDRLHFAKIKNKTFPEINLELLRRENTLKGKFVSEMLDLIESDKENGKLYRDALNLGLKAFYSEVYYDEN